jgi:hypothetical protein
MKRSELARAVRERVETGEPKRKIFDDLSQKGSPALTAALLAGAAGPGLRRRYSRLNSALVAIMLLGAALKIGAVVDAVRGLPLAAQVLLIALAPLINLLFLAEIARWRGYAYRIYGWLGVVSLLRSFRPDSIPTEGTGAILLFFLFLAITVSGIALSFYLAAKLFPDLGLFGARKDAAGSYRITEDPAATP